MKVYRFNKFNEDTWNKDSDDYIQNKYEFDLKRDEFDLSKTYIEKKKNIIQNYISNLKYNDIKFLFNKDIYDYKLYDIVFPDSFTVLLKDYVDYYKTLLNKFITGNNEFIYIKSLKNSMFDEEYNFQKNPVTKQDIIELKFKITLDSNNEFDFIIDGYYIPAFLQSKGLAKLIVLSAIHNFGYIRLTSNPSNHKALNIIQSILTNETVYINKYDNFFLCLSKSFNNAKEIANDINKHNILLVQDPDL